MPLNIDGYCRGDFVETDMPKGYGVITRIEDNTRVTVRYAEPLRTLGIPGAKHPTMRREGENETTFDLSNEFWRQKIRKAERDEVPGNIKKALEV